MSSTPYIVLEKLGEGTYATVHKVSVVLPDVYRICEALQRDVRHALRR